METIKSNMNQESIKSIKDFNKKQVESNIKLHKVFLSMVIVVNIILVIFIIIYKLKISSIKSKSDNQFINFKRKSRFYYFSSWKHYAQINKYICYKFEYLEIFIFL